MILVKICGITNLDDALDAARLGADMLGFVFYDRSPRAVDPASVGRIAAMLPPHIARVGVFVDETAERVRAVAREAALDILQFHGDETPAYCAAFAPAYKTIKAFRIADRRSLERVNGYRSDYYLFDADAKTAKGGAGIGFDRRLLDGFAPARPYLLAGGLTPETVVAAAAGLAPYGVDVSTGVEARPGKKDAVLMRRFIEAVKGVR